MAYDDFKANNNNQPSMAGAKAAGKYRIEGKAYEVKDGDIVSSFCLCWSSVSVYFWRLWRYARPPERCLRLVGLISDRFLASPPSNITINTTDSLSI